MERETKEFKTPSGRVATLKTYLTQRETDTLIEMEKFKTIRPGNINDISVSLSNDFDKEITKAIVVAVDGVKEKVDDIIADLPAADGRAIREECGNIFKLGFQTAK